MISNQIFNGRVALVTGAGGGQGAAHARVLAEGGAFVYLTDINVPAVESEAKRLTDSGLKAQSAELDVSSSKSWQEAANTIRGEHGKLDILVNNAGMLDMLSFEDATEETWQRTIDINQKGAFLGIKMTLDLLRQSSGASVINTSSIYALIGAPDYVA